MGMEVTLFSERLGCGLHKPPETINLTRMFLQYRNLLCAFANYCQTKANLVF